MYTSNELEALSLVFDEQMKQLQQDIMSDLIRRLAINGEITRAADWQINRLYELGVSKEKIESFIQKSLKLSDDEMTELYKNAIESGYARNEGIYKKTGTKFIPFDENAELQQLISAVGKQTAENMYNISQSLGFAVKNADGTLSFKPIAQYYQDTLDNAINGIANGVFDYNTVLKKTVREMTNSGLRTVDYASGWSNRVDVAARRAVMTGMAQLTGKVNEMNAEELGTDTYEVSWHSGARPSHQVWQGKWYTKEQLVTVCGLGEVTGLNGANCYHDYYPVVPGISEPAYTAEELEELNCKENTPVKYGDKEYTKYEALQRQRRLETTMRAQRQKIKLLEVGGADEDDIISARCRYRGTSQEYTRFSKAMDLPQQRERVTVDGLGNIGQGKWKKSVDKKPEKSIINIEIDELVPCLRDNRTGEIVDTEVEEINDVRKLSQCTEKNGWDFPWNRPPKDSKVFALCVKGSKDIEGLIALKNDEEACATYMYWGNAAPHNRITAKNSKKRYNGVGGHLFAVAAQESLKNGFGGYIYADAANKQLFDLFVNEYKATPIPTRENPYRFLLEGNAIKSILDMYNFEWR